ncbi:hypothetical protein GWI33_010068, partial [Rhynchophorus ferrugineus]
AGQQALQRALTGKTARFTGKSGIENEIQHWDNILTPILDEHGQTHQILCVSRDTTLQKNTELKLATIIQIDELTGLHNCRIFRQHIKNLMNRAKKKKTKIGIMFMGVDQFKLINDSLGHVVGDYLLKVLAKRLIHFQNERILVARLGGDEFAVVVDQLKDRQELLQLAESILKKIAKPVVYNGKYMQNSASIGCAIFPDHAIDAIDLMKAASSMLNHLKLNTYGGIDIFNEKIAKYHKSNAEQLVKCQTIIKEQMIEVFYQPQVDITTGQVIGYEALLRWVDEQGQVHLPQEIYKAFEHYDLARKIGQIVQNQVVQDIKKWQALGVDIPTISINAVPVEFLGDDYAENFLKILEEHNIASDLIQIEITEHAHNEQGSDYIVRALNILKQHGIRIALDDFGVGHSSLVRLRDYPVNGLKLDASFVQSIGDDEKNYSIVRALIELASSLELNIIAEGIETEQQRQQLIQMGYQYGQGFLFSPAIRASQMPLYSSCLSEL